MNVSIYFQFILRCYYSNIVLSNPFLLESAIESFEKGKTYYNCKNYALAFFYFNRANRSGHVRSSTYLGKMYQYGLGTIENGCKALVLYTSAAEKDDAVAQRILGYLHYNGEITGRPDYIQASGWFHRSADNGNYGAYKGLGLMYLDGKGTKKNYKKGLEWLEKAVDKGLVGILSIIGEVYIYGGYGVNQDFELAETWFMKGLNDQDSRSLYGMGLLYGVRDDSKQSWNKAFEWFTKATRYDESEAQISLGRMYQNGLGCKKNYKLARKWYELAVKNGNPEGYANLGKMRHYGHGITIDYDIALDLYKKAGDCGEALNGIGLLYQGGRGVFQNHNTAMMYFKKAADKESEGAYNSLGNTYRHGYSTNVNLQLAFKYYTMSANYFSEYGMFNLGLMYGGGIGTKADKNLALYWFRRAELFGEEKAKQYIHKIVSSSTQFP